MTQHDVIHLVLGDHGAGLLAYAVAHHGLVGQVFCIPDDLGHGPLDDGVARVDYMRNCYYGFGAWTHTATDAFSAWRALEALVSDGIDDVVVWAGANASEHVLLAMTCWRFREGPARLHLVELPHGKHTGRHSSRELAAKWASVRALGDAEQMSLAVEFETLRDAAGQRRRWDGDHAEAVAVSAFDHLIVQALSSDWRPATEVVRRAMLASEPRDGLSDLFLSWRLNCLIREGHVEADRPPASLGDYAVRSSAV